MATTRRLIAIDSTTSIPITTINGAKPGPTLALIAGNHGYEYPPILALQQLAWTIHARAESIEGKRGQLFDFFHHATFPKGT
jgi:predicted deacylase